MQYELFDITPTKPKHTKAKRNPFNSIWLRAYVDALVNNRQVTLYLKY
jgi:hypothetical protein